MADHVDPVGRSGFLTSPLLHFIVGGAALFVLYGQLNPADDAPEADPSLAPMTITVDAEQVEALSSGLATEDPAALDEAIAAYVRGEVLYREALEAGLLEGDVTVRQRMIDMMRYTLEDQAQLPEPTDDALQAYYDAHQDLFAEAPRISFRQVFVRRGDDVVAAEARAEDLGAALTADTDPSTLGDPPPRRTHVVIGEPLDDIATLYGQAFANRLATAAPGAWQGPFASDLGYHWVWVTESLERPVRPLTEVAPEVRARLIEEGRRQAEREAIDALVANYDVVIER